MLKRQILEDLKGAMKSGDTRTRDTLRTLDSAIKNEEIAQNKREEGLDDSSVVKIIKRFIKQRKDSVEQFKKGGREDLAKDEQEEIGVLEKYLPKQMTREEIEVVVKKIMQESGIESKKDMGELMKLSMKELGELADGSVVRDIVNKLLI